MWLLPQLYLGREGSANGRDCMCVVHVAEEFRLESFIRPPWV